MCLVDQCILCILIPHAGQPQTVEVGVRPTSNFPLDIYYLMDDSSSMLDDLENLKALASQLGLYNS